MFYTSNSTIANAFKQKHVMSFEYLDVVEIGTKATKLLADKQYKTASTLLEEIAPYIGGESLIFQMSFYGKWGQACLGQELFEEAISHTKYGIDLNDAESTNEKVTNLRARLQLSLVSIYKERQDYKAALAILTTILNEGKNQKDAVYLKSLHLTADIYSKEGQLSEALNYYQDALTLAQELNNSQVFYSATFNLGEVYAKQANYQAALVCYQQALDYLEKENISYQKGKLLHNMGIVYSKLNQWNKAMKCYKQILDIKDSWKKEPSAMPSLQKSIGVLYLNQGNLAQATFYLSEAWETAKTLDNDSLSLTILSNLSVLHKKKGEFEQALQYLEQHQNLQEDVYKRKCSKQLKKAEESHRVIKEQREKELLKKQKDRIKVLLKDLHHRIKNDFQCINSMMGHHLSQSKEEPIIKGIMQEVCNRTQAMSFLHQALYQEDKITVNNLDNYLPQIVDHLCYSYKKEVIKHINIKEEEIAAKKAREIGLIVNELVSNSLKYAFPKHLESQPTIWLTVEKTTLTNLQIVIKDNGVGMPKGMDWQNSNSTGLLLVGFWIENLQANMQLLSHQSMGTCWIIDIPIKEAAK